MKNRLLFLVVLILVCINSYGQKFLKKYRKNHSIEQLSNGYFVSGRGEFKVFDNDGNVLFEHEKDAVVLSQYSAEYNMIYYTIGHKLAKHACFRDESVDVLCSYNLTTGVQKEYLYRKVYSNFKTNEKDDFLIFFTDIETDKQGVMKGDETFLFKPEYDVIYPFDRKVDRFLIIKDNYYYIANRDGENVLGDKFVYNDKSDLSKYYLDHRLCIRGTRDGVHYGLFDIEAKKVVLPFEYKKIGNNYSGGIIHVVKDKYSLLLNYNDNKIIIDESYKIEDIKDVEERKGELFITTQDLKSSNIRNVIYKGKYVFSPGTDDFKVEDISLNSKSNFIWGTIKGSNTKVVYNFSKEVMLDHTLVDWLVDYELLSISYFENNENLLYFVVKNNKGEKLTTLMNIDGECLVPLDSDGRIKILDVPNQKRLYLREKTDHFRAKITSAFVNCSKPVVLDFRGERLSIQFNEERKLYFFSDLVSRPLTPEQNRSGKTQSYNVIISHFDSEWNVIDKHERFEYDR